MSKATSSKATSIRKAKAEAIAKSTNVPELQETRRKARAIGTYYGKRRDAYDEQADATETALRCERRLGELCASIVDRTPKKKRAPGNATVLADLQISHTESSRWQRLAAVPEEAFEAYLAEARADLARITIAAAIAAGRRANGEGDPALAQFHTPGEVARRMVEWLELAGDAPRILEPSAGTGVLVRAVLALYPRAQIDAIEIDAKRWDALEAIEGVHVVRGDYLAQPASEPYDAIITNPPFTKGAETAHLACMLDHARRIVALLPARSLHGDERFRHVWRRMGVDWWLRRKAHLVTRPKFEGDGGTDEIVIVRLDREPGECLVEWWELEA